jgi:hypothetical protein
LFFAHRLVRKPGWPDFPGHELLGPMLQPVARSFVFPVSEIVFVILIDGRFFDCVRNLTSRRKLVYHPVSLKKY